MPTPTKAAPAKGEDTKAARSTVSAKDQFEKVLAVISKAPEGGVSLKDLSTATGLTYRQLHNVTWRMEGSPKEGRVTKPDEAIVHRTGDTTAVRYAPGKAPKAPTFRGKYVVKGQ
jgi:hypothetical protein